MKTSEYAAVAAVHSVDPDRWQSEFSAVLDRIEPRFARYEPLRHAVELMAGMVSGLDRKNCWTIAEHRGVLALIENDQCCSLKVTTLATCSG